MIRLFASFFLFLLLAAVEFSFFSGLPWPLSATPLIFACSLYLFQHLGSNIGLWWLLALGVYLDFWRLGLIFGETFVYAAAALFAVFLGRRFFTNRSLYGILGNAILSFWFLQSIRLGWFFFETAGEGFLFPWRSAALVIFWQTVFLLLLITILFFLARRIRFFLKPLLIVSESDNS